MFRGQSQDLAKTNVFHRATFQSLIMLTMAAIVVMFALVLIIVYQVLHKPLPEFSAIKPTGERMQLNAYHEPNTLPGTILTWASKAAVAAYTFDFAGYESQTALAKPYFTPAGWQAYQAGIKNVIRRITKQKLFVNGVVSAPPVISNQGELPGHGYSWRVQIPFLVTYQSSQESKTENYYVSMTIVKVPTTINPQGIGIEQFDMS
jgi:intracellular multiplication protein IcmL